MNSEYKTLRELDVKPGDVVEYGPGGGVTTVTHIADGLYYGDGNRADCPYCEDAAFRIVSRAPRDNSDLPSGMAWTPLRDNDTPKMWRDMTPEEKGALLLAHHEGKAIEVYNANTGEWREVRAEWIYYKAYRIRPEPKRETVSYEWNCSYGFYGNDGPNDPKTNRNVTLPLIDGDLPAGTYPSAEGHEIIVEKIND